MSEAVTCNNSNSSNSNDNFGLMAHSPWSSPGLGASGLAYLMLSITPEGMFCCTEKVESQSGGVPVAVDSKARAIPGYHISGV